MHFQQTRHSFFTCGRGTLEVTETVAEDVQRAGVLSGLAHVFLHHTSASLMLCENADPSVRRDLERYFGRLVQDGDPMFEHRVEGADDMAAHVRSVLTHNDLTIPIANGRLALGTWQGIYLWEHRYQGHERKVTVSVQGMR
ncbi:secondary thiamine-phosphate synthase enzyme [Alkalispirillum mobile]|uniref:Secondary thiamine-phosphate synthase enzyme n=1 Tax=Alkalispirillum mobile TaxID=85925 RepID=A0A498CB53_9GAMM|nr:secondary thiamine-phosphate synthase enzyme YjbQ [Alkalispirillum mobile]RLK50260.1 secondary thiamine-phosphate synthase enzyme [Alkalispirillum mobile]